MAKPNEYLTIGETARRAGIATSALRFYETRRLVSAKRGTGNQRLYHRSMLRKISIIKIAQTLGFSLREIEEAFATLPNKHTPTKRDWEKLSVRWRDQLEERIACMQRMRDQLTGCIGCGCLSLRRCALYNKGDHASTVGPGARYLLDGSHDDAVP